MPTRNRESPVSPIDSRSEAEETTTHEDPAHLVTGPIESMIRQIGIDKVYGTPITEGETTVVPVAELRTGFGFGSGTGDETEHEGGGGGGGAGLRITPRGYLQITSDGVRYRPIYDPKLFVVGGAFVGWLVYRLLSR